MTCCEYNKTLFFLITKNNDKNTLLRFIPNAKIYPCFTKIYITVQWVRSIVQYNYHAFILSGRGPIRHYILGQYSSKSVSLIFIRFCINFSSALHFYSFILMLYFCIFLTTAFISALLLLTKLHLFSLSRKEEIKVKEREKSPRIVS